MKVAFFTESYHPIVSGVVVSVETFARQLEARGVEVRIFTPRFPGYRDEDPTVVRLPALNLPTNPRYPLGPPWWPPARRAVREWGADLVHVHGPFLVGRLGAGIARGLGLPLVFTMHTRYEHYAHYVPLPRPLVYWVAKTLSRRFANACDLVIAPSPGFAASLREMGITARIEAICTGLDFAGMPRPGKGERAAWGIPADVPLLLAVGRLAVEKNVEMLLTALSRLQHKGAHLLFVGGGPLQQQAKRISERLGVADRVHFAGYQPHERVFACAADADLFVFPSVTDTQGIVILEAMAQGLPCVCTESPAVLGVVEQGANGLVVKDDAAAFAQAVDSLLADGEGRRAMGEQACKTAAEYDITHCTDRLVALYDELIAARKARRKA